MTGAVAWLLGVAIVALVAAVAIRRTAGLARRTRQLERLQADVVGISQRLAAIVDPLVGSLDEVRRGAGDPAGAGAAAEAARAGLRDLGRETRALRSPAALADRVASLAWEVDRAARSADLAAHGLAQMARARHDADAEAQTSLKRGTLGLRHAREAVTRVMVEVAGLRPADLRAMPAAAGRGPDAGPVGALPEDDLPLGAGGPPSP